MLNIALVCKYVAHMGHWPSGFSKIKLTSIRLPGVKRHTTKCTALCISKLIGYDIVRWLRITGIHKIKVFLYIQSPRLIHLSVMWSYDYLQVILSSVYVRTTTCNKIQMRNVLRMVIYWRSRVLKILSTISPTVARACISIHWSYLRGSRAHSVYCIGYITQVCLCIFSVCPTLSANQGR